MIDYEINIPANKLDPDGVEYTGVFNKRIFPSDIKFKHSCASISCGGVSMGTFSIRTFLGISLPDPGEELQKLIAPVIYLETIAE